MLYNDDSAQASSGKGRYSNVPNERCSHNSFVLLVWDQLAEQLFNNKVNQDLGQETKRGGYLMTQLVLSSEKEQVYQIPSLASL